MNTADIKDDSGRQIDYESFLDYKKDFNDTRTLNFTSSEFFNDKRAQREDEFYDKAFYGGTAAVTAKLGYDYVNSGGAILEKFNALRSSNLLNERLKAASNASPFETLYQDFADPSTRSLSNSLQSQLLLLEELSPLHILKTLQISSFTTLFVEVVDSKNRQTIIGSESIRVYEKYYRNLIMNNSKISLSDANIDNGFILENKKLYQRLGNGDRGDVLLNYASAVNTNLEIGEQNSPNRVFQKFANIHGVDTRMDQFKKEPIAIVGGSSKYKTQVDWMRAYTRFSMEIGYKVLDNPLGFVEEYSAALGAGESKVFQSKTFQMAKKVLNVNIGTGGVYNEGTRESLKMLTKNLGTKSLIGYLGYQGINSFLDDVTPESSVWNDGITSGIAANYAKGRVGFARAWSDRFQGYKERQEEAAPESTSLLTLIGLPLAGAMTGANAAYFQRMYDTKTMGAEAAAQKHSVEKKFQGYLGQSLEAINMNKASTTVRRYSKLGAVMTGALTLPFLPGALVGTSSEELAAEYSGDKEVAVRADRGWLMGGQALEGGKIKYHRKSLVAEGIANAKEKTLYENSDEKRAQDPIYSPFRYLKNPYAFEEAHTDDMPYPVWGMDVTYGSFLGKAFQGTFGKIIKPDVMNPIVENFGKGKTGLVDAGLNAAGLGTEEKGSAEQQLADFEGGRTRNEAYVVPVNEDSKTKSLVQSGDMMAAPSPISNANIRAAVGGYTAGSDFIGMKGFAGNLTSRAMGIDPEEQLEPQLAVSGSARTAKKSIIDMQLGDAGGCFIPTTRVMTKEGYKEIQDITTDDYVLSKESIYQKVNQVFPKLFKDTTLLKIDLGLGIKPIICTPDHVFPSLKRERYSKGHMKPNYSKIVSDREIGDLNVGDILIYQNIGDERLEYIDLKAKTSISSDKYIYPNVKYEKYPQLVEAIESNPLVSRKELREMGFEDSQSKDMLSRFKGVKSKPSRFNRYLKSSYGLGVLIGWWLSEGSLDKGRITISLHKKEMDFANEITRIVKDLLGVSTFLSLKTESLGMDLRFNHKIFSDFLRENFKTGSKNKQIPFEYQKDPILRKGLLYGLMHGDGWHNQEIRLGGFTTISENLAEAVSTMLRKEGILSVMIRKYDASGNHILPEAREIKSFFNPRYYININQEESFMHYLNILKVKPIKNSFDKPTNNRYFSIDNNLYVSIKSIETLSYTGTLYDLNIENTPYYTVEDILCHNSGEFIRRLIPQSSATDKDSINPMANTIASDWLPSNETKYYKNFKRGDFYSETTEHGETLLPSKGFAELNPELKGVDPNDYPLVYQYKILQNVARGSSEHIATRNYLLENTDSLTEREQEIFFEAYGQEKDREQEKKFYEYKTSEDKAKLNILQTAQNALWESFSHKESPLEPLTPFRPMAKFVHQRTAIEDYKRTQIAGSDAAIWTKPNEHFISPTKNRLLQSFNGAYKPEDVQEKENIDEYFDKLALIKSLRTGDQYKAERTVAALASSGIRDASSMRQFKNALPDNQKPYVEAFAKETNAEKRREIMELLPTDIGRAYSSIWQNMDGLNYAKEHNLDPKEFLDSQYIKDSGILKNNKNIDLSSDVTEAIRVKSQDITSSSERKKYIDMAESKAIRLEAARRDAEEYIQHQTGALPEDDWVGWDPRLTIDDIKLKTLSVGKADLQRFGYWDKEIRRNDRIKILDKDTDIVNDYDDIRRSVKANTERRYQTKVALRKQGFEASRIDYIPSNKNAVRIINKQEYLNNFEE